MFDNTAAVLSAEVVLMIVVLVRPDDGVVKDRMAIVVKAVFGFSVNDAPVADALYEVCKLDVVAEVAEGNNKVNKGDVDVGNVRGPVDRDAALPVMEPMISGAVLVSKVDVVAAGDVDVEVNLEIDVTLAAAILVLFDVIVEDNDTKEVVVGGVAVATTEFWVKLEDNAAVSFALPQISDVYPVFPQLRNSHHKRI